ncbi:AI-2E family transporter [Tepidibacter formicigenes]|jgi:predicted PurR-regulated permease PerM|uniref:Predicted PurR-regulated permease PerM n=1 Tax=Tepidibacter formicigenes DSM 15518 TaxID=1123349 RepID=A0A1M6M951_9FIRM|nr:AI-2E family transporter [Tepidibacter formicigenes]SHJ79986.1 Predicted PurR-regulated permease PerM [Tepidibacter formicigenes DSM 15518]
MFSNEKTKYFIFILFISLILFKFVNNTEFFIQKLSFFTSLINPFIWAFAIAYLLNPIMIYFENNFKIKRGFSILLIYVLLLGIINFTITILTPRIVSSINELSKDMPGYVTTAQNWINQNIIKSKLLQFSNPYLKQNINTIINEALNFLNITSSNLVTKAINITSNLFNGILGLIISIYLLKDKENLINNTKRLFYALIGKNKSDKLINFCKLVNKIFSQYIVGKAIDSLIIAVICFAGLLILKIPYALLISIIIGITNMIPYFGPFIGAVPSILITLLNSPISALWVGIFIFLLQQFDGLYLGPKILGDKVGLSPLWIIVAVIIGGGAFGLLGMFLGVPAMAIIKIQLEKYINIKLGTKDS